MLSNFFNNHNLQIIKRRGKRLDTDRTKKTHKFRVNELDRKH